MDLVLSKESGKRLITSVISFVNSLLEGKSHKDFVHIIFGGHLLAMDKKFGGICPIVVRYVWRRLAAKCASVHAIDTLADYFTRLQLGVGVPGDWEAAVHVTKRFLSNMPDDYIIAKLYFFNAFNCLHRNAMLERVNEIIP